MTTYWLVRSKSDSKSVRIVQAKSKNAARQYIYSDLWEEPKKADAADWAMAMNAQAKVEVANGA